jgi:hypothetical protein
MDDGTLGGDLDTLVKDCNLIVAEERKLGLVVNTAKYEIITDEVRLREVQANCA